MHAHAACAEKNRNVGELDREYRKSWHHLLQIARDPGPVWRTLDRRCCQRNRLFSARPQLAFPRHSGMCLMPQPTQPLGNRVHRYRPRCPLRSMEAISAECVLGDKRSRKPETRIPKGPFHVQSPYFRGNALCSCKCLQTRHALATRSLLQPQRSRNRLPLVHAIYGPNHLAQIKGGSLKKHPFRLIWPNQIRSYP